MPTPTPRSRNPPIRKSPNARSSPQSFAPKATPFPLFSVILLIIIGAKRSRCGGDTIKKDGKVTLTGRIIVSADGKSRVASTSEAGAKGQGSTNRAAYDKQ